MNITVVTKAGEDGGNLAMAQVTHLDMGLYGGSGPTSLMEVPPGIMPPQLFIAMRSPVFTVGEILILDGGGREVSGAGRKPSKWDVETEEFDTLEAAVERAREVTA